jgi:hypothetical protein
MSQLHRLTCNNVLKRYLKTYNIFKMFFERYYNTCFVLYGDHQVLNFLLYVICLAHLILFCFYLLRFHICVGVSVTCANISLVFLKKNNINTL